MEMTPVEVKAILSTWESGIEIFFLLPFVNKRGLNYALASYRVMEDNTARL